MSQSGFLNDFSTLGILLQEWLGGYRKLAGLDRAVELAYAENHFFTPSMQRYAISAITSQFLSYDKLSGWMNDYRLPSDDAFSGKCVGIVMAGNIPLVGFHDFLTVMASGARAVIKLSSKDRILLPAIFSLLCEIDGRWKRRAEFILSKDADYDYLNLFSGADAVIATGGDEAKAAIAVKLGEKPLLARGSRFSYAVIDNENIGRLDGLANDVFLYFGMGCRSISYFLIKRGTEISGLIDELKNGESLVSRNPAYMNSYKRIRAIYRMEGREFADGGFFIMAEESETKMPMGLIGYRYYDSGQELADFAAEKLEKKKKKYRIFGMAQSPSIADYADNIDTMNFLIESL